MPGSATVLFVDDDPNVLAGLRRTVHLIRPPWEAAFVIGAEEALAFLATHPVRAVVSDMQMPGMDGAELLSLVRERYPAVARLILSGCTDRNLVITSIGPTQQFLCMPVDSRELLGALDHLMTLHQIVTDPELQKIFGGVDSLPKPPEICQRLTAVTADPDYEVDDLVTVVQSDLDTTADVLRLVNSTFFGLPTRVDSVFRAVTLLGASTIRTLALADGIFTSHCRPATGLDGARLAQHGLQVAAIARRIAEAEGWPSAAVADMFLAGMLHEIGLPVLACSQPEAWEGLRQVEPTDLWAEQSLQVEWFGCSVSQGSAYLLGLWGFPAPVVQAIAGQPADATDPGATPGALLLTFARHVVRNPDDRYLPPGSGYLDAARLSRWLDWSDLPGHTGSDQRSAQPSQPSQLSQLSPDDVAIPVRENTRPTR